MYTYIGLGYVTGHELTVFRGDGSRRGEVRPHSEGGAQEEQGECEAQDEARGAEQGAQPGGGGRLHPLRGGGGQAQEDSGGTRITAQVYTYRLTESYELVHYSYVHYLTQSLL